MCSKTVLMESWISEPPSNSLPLPFENSVRRRKRSEKRTFLRERTRVDSFSMKKQSLSRRLLKYNQCFLSRAFVSRASVQSVHVFVFVCVCVACVCVCVKGG